MNLQDCHINIKFSGMTFAELIDAERNLTDRINARIDQVERERVPEKALQLDDECLRWISEAREIDAEIEARRLDGMGRAA